MFMINEKILTQYKTGTATTDASGIFVPDINKSRPIFCVVVYIDGVSAFYKSELLARSNLASWRIRVYDANNALQTSKEITYRIWYL